MPPTFILSIFLLFMLGFISYLFANRKNLIEASSQETPGEKVPLFEKQPEPLPENPAEAPKLRHALEKAQIPFEELGKLKRIYGQMIYGIQTKPGLKKYTWEMLTETLPELGYWPVFVSPEVFNFSENPEDLGTVISTQPEITIYGGEHYPIEDFLCKIEDWLVDRQKQIKNGEYWGTDKIPAPDSLPPIDSASIPSSRIAFIPTPHSWQVPAYFLLYSLSLEINETLAVLRHWQKMYGAKIVYFSPEQMLMEVNRQPETKAEALQLAYEQMDFCGDLFQNKYAYPEELAADLMRRSDWEFIWKQHS